MKNGGAVLPDTSPSDRLRLFISDAAFPCVGARSSLAQDHLDIFEAGDLRDEAQDRQVLQRLYRLRRERLSTSSFRSVAVVYALTPPLSEARFEAALWRRLDALHELDRGTHAWSDSVSSDPRAPNFAMSFGGMAFYIVGLHPKASRLARRAPQATLVFNPHEQFRLLREQSLYSRLQSAIRQRDVALQGDSNPMLAEHGVRSEAVQYSGRKIAGSWACPFQARPGKNHAN